MQVNSGQVFNYKQFILWLTELVQNSKTSGSNQSASLVEFTALNLKRMERLNKTIELDPLLLNAVEQIHLPQKWTVLTEAWCGDSAQTLPLIARLENASNGNIKLQIVLRDEQPELMDGNLTDMSRSIPILISHDSVNNKLFRWGPRPKPAQDLLINWKRFPGGKTWNDFEKELHTWYAKDKTRTIQNEFLELIKNVNPRYT
jgi:hypothetical protein